MIDELIPLISRSLSCARRCCEAMYVAHRLARLLRGAAAVTACRRHDAHIHQSTTMRCSVQRSDRATMDRRSSHVPCSTPPRVPSSASCSLAHGWATGQAIVRSLGVTDSPSGSLGEAAPSLKTVRRSHAYAGHRGAGCGVHLLQAWRFL